MNKFHLEYPIGRGGFGKVIHTQIYNIFKKFRYGKLNAN